VPLTPDREARRDEILERAMDLAGADRTAYLEATCAGDPEMAAEVLRLLVLNAELDSSPFLEQPAPFDPEPAFAGLRIGRYQIETSIGSGGAGEVFRALDTQIHRRVALKVLRTRGSNAESREKFLRELRTLGSINHENVVQLYDCGEHEGTLYLVLEYLAGEDLNEAIRGQRCGDLSARIEIARQMIAGLDHIHQAGILHRDIKPSNLFLLPNGRVKLMDFGIARADGNALTQTGNMVGTPAYMAPEQLVLESSQLTAAVDVHALGITLFELFTGLRAFPGNTIGQILEQVRTHEVSAEPLLHAGVPAGLAAFIVRCTAKDPAQRPRDLVAAFAEAVYASPPAAPRPLITAKSTRSVSRRAALAIGVLTAGGGAWWALRSRSEQAGITALAVLPFRNQTGDPSYDHISMGLTEGLITALGYLKGLRVSARAAVLAFQNTTVDPMEAGRRLKVGAIVTGAVALRGPGVFAVSAELADTEHASHLWGATETFPEGELAKVQGSLARNISTALHVEPGAPGKTAFQEQTRSGGAYQDYLYGRYSLNKRTLDGYQRAVEYFTRAVEADPGFAQAWAGLADSYSFQGGPKPPKDVFPLAQKAAGTALTLNPALAEAHASAGFIQLQYEWNWPAAEQSFRRALELNENDSAARGRLARLLLVLGRFAEAERELIRVHQLDPVSLTNGTTLANCHYLGRQFERALEDVERVLALEPNFMVALDMKADILVELRRYAEATPIYAKEVESSPQDASALASLVRVSRLAGDSAAALTYAQRFRRLAAERPVNPVAIAIVEIAEDSPDRAIAALQEGYRQRYWPLIFLKVSPLWDSLRERVEFQNLLRAMNLA
jgi:eukaryotic-like serine/threonine-protein kinase